ncbi:HPr family phosphocarrier protein [Sneathiella sp. P13V-1]|uniref:HPr family phosphocarrier protein n=1 Tax=Sneathiella sp. P13V-1 TaxID=2697366 RepID=UPI00187B9AFD|nr:HPr family phosphocarrier protein [Sneathiella sp. P13V-1]MBE7636015.1 HPr family phosphocarrier protein [Sneathiella sp. P13V-1]
MSEPLRKTLQIENKRGLHARAAAKFVKCVESYDADILVTKDDNNVSGASIMGLMMLAASKGTSIDVEASGAEADAAMSAIETLVNDRFGEE